MKLNLRTKLIGSFAVIIVLITAAVILSINVVTETRYRVLVREGDIFLAQSLAPALAEWYAERDSWNGIEPELQRIGAPRGMMGMHPPGRTGPMTQPFARILLTRSDGTVITDTAGIVRGSFSPSDSAPPGVPINVGGETVGRLYAGTMIESALSGVDRAFLRALQSAALVAALVTSAIALAVGSLLFRHITAPLSRLSAATRVVASGNLNVRVPAETDDEFGKLGEQFNRMIEALGDSRRAQQRLIADSAHELRTPVTLIQGTLEMMIDGIYPIDRARIESLYDETLRLGKLVSELKELSEADKSEHHSRSGRLRSCRSREECPYPFQGRSAETGDNAVYRECRQRDHNAC